MSDLQNPKKKGKKPLAFIGPTLSPVASAGFDALSKAVYGPTLLVRVGWETQVSFFYKDALGFYYGQRVETPF